MSIEHQEGGPAPAKATVTPGIMALLLKHFEGKLPLTEQEKTIIGDFIIRDVGMLKECAKEALEELSLKGDEFSKHVLRYNADWLNAHGTIGRIIYRTKTGSHFIFERIINCTKISPLRATDGYTSAFAQALEAAVGKSTIRCLLRPLGEKDDQGREKFSFSDRKGLNGELSLELLETDQADITPWSR